MVSKSCEPKSIEEGISLNLKAPFVSCAKCKIFVSTNASSTSGPVNLSWALTRKFRYLHLREFSLGLEKRNPICRTYGDFSEYQIDTLEIAPSTVSQVLGAQGQMMSFSDIAARLQGSFRISLARRYGRSAQYLELMRKMIIYRCSVIIQSIVRKKFAVRRCEVKRALNSITVC
mmetsp:Transcript_21947/g.30850  ORF Transcript_21947/g.30850 Transcript_21947/m.30850 type:complete len:174 (+) Transcript_21947:153-674(+)